MTEDARSRTFKQGYIDGWRSVLGQGAPLPTIPAFAVPAGKTEYQHGFEQGRAVAAGK